jgi:5-methylcytosine-specific restriction endonuclease McrA
MTNPLPRVLRPCSHCGTLFLGVITPKRKFCSRRCDRVFHRRMDRDRRRAMRFRESGPVDRMAVFERDRWTCQLCRHPVDRSLPPGHPGSATLDHVVPLSRGGGHDQANLQLGHWSCNKAKGAQAA